LETPTSRTKTCKKSSLPALFTILLLAAAAALTWKQQQKPLPPPPAVVKKAAVSVKVQKVIRIAPDWQFAVLQKDDEEWVMEFSSMESLKADDELAIVVDASGDGLWKGRSALKFNYLEPEKTEEKEIIKLFRPSPEEKKD
jgi:hypothetical protein